MAFKERQQGWRPSVRQEGKAHGRRKENKDRRGRHQKGPRVQRTARPRRPNGMPLTKDGDTVRTVHLPLRRIALCLDCETWYQIGTGPCPTCGSGTWAPVARFLTGDLTRS